MTPEQLKGSILQAAIKGKLSSQSNADSNVDEALEKMRRQREELINEGKLKKEGKINKTADTEIDIPSTWRLVPLKELVCKRVDNRGKTPPHSQVKTPNECIDLLEIASIVPGKSIDHSRVEKFVTEETYNRQRGFVEKDDILIATVGSIGKFALMDDTKSAVAQNIIAIKCFDIVDQHYVFYLLQSPYFYSAMGCIKMEAVQASIKVPDLMNLNVPLPPIEEQHRIVAKIEELLPYVDRYAEAYEKLEQFNAKFPEDMKKSILQYAIQGKLVEQRPEEGTAEELFSEIQNEKNALIKEKKIKKEKPQPEVCEEDIPFDIPDNWKWVRVGELGSWASGATPSRTNPQFYGGTIPWLKTGDLNDGYIEEVPEYITDLALEKTSVRLNPEGSVLMAMYGATIGKLGILNKPMTTNQACCACIPFTGVFNKYLFYFLMSQRGSYIGMAEGGAQPNISKEKIVSSVIPLPPLEEQHRIVAKIEELLPYCDRLVK